MDEYFVNASLLNLRSSQSSADSANILVTLPRGQVVTVLDMKESWSSVVARLSGVRHEGFVATRFLAKRTATTERLHASVDAVHMPVVASGLQLTTGRACPLPDGVVAKRDPTVSSADQVASLRRIIAALDVEHSARYAPTSKATYCNIYAYDYCYFAGAYLPRVWWTSKAILEISGGSSRPVRYGETVSELNANGLYDWLGEWGDDFGWQLTDSVEVLQQRVNAGAVGVVCGKRREVQKAGHITAVVPENEALGRRAQYVGLVMRAPLQSQAGRKNLAYLNTSWWTNGEFQGVRFAFHTGGTAAKTAVSTTPAMMAVTMAAKESRGKSVSEWLTALAARLDGEGRFDGEGEVLASGAGILVAREVAATAAIEKYVLSAEIALRVTRDGDRIGGRIFAEATRSVSGQQTEVAEDAAAELRGFVEVINAEWNAT